MPGKLDCSERDASRARVVGTSSEQRERCCATGVRPSPGAPRDP
jgi:hypothetical protein